MEVGVRFVCAFLAFACFVDINFLFSFIEGERMYLWMFVYRVINQSSSEIISCKCLLRLLPLLSVRPNIRP